MELRPCGNSGSFIKIGHEDGWRAKNGCFHILKLLRNEMQTSLSDAEIKYCGIIRE